VNGIALLSNHRHPAPHFISRLKNFTQPSVDIMSSSENTGQDGTNADTLKQLESPAEEKKIDPKDREAINTGLLDKATMETLVAAGESSSRKRKELADKKAGGSAQS
jgi:hypothetical protein